MQVFNIRGTTSSGKSTLMRNLITSSKENEVITLTEHVKAHLIKHGVVIGLYKKGSKFGGCDGISKVVYMEEAIWKALQIRPNVFFEGLLVSHSFERWINFSEELRKKQRQNKAKPYGMIWAFITPPFRENLRRLKKRNRVDNLRKAKGDKFVLNFIQRYKSIIRLRKKVEATKGENIYILDHWYSLSHLATVIKTFEDDKLMKKQGKGGIGKYIKKVV